MKKLNIGEIYTVDLNKYSDFAHVTDVVIDSDYDEIENGYWAIDSEGNAVVVTVDMIFS